MKKLSIAFVATLSLVAFAGCKKKGGGGDCDSTVNSAVDRMMDQQMKEGMKDEKMTPEMKKMAEDMAKSMGPKMKAAMTKSCKDDKWSAEALKCIDDAKTEKDFDACESKFTPEQRKNMEKAMSEAMGMGGGHDMDKPAGGDMAGSAAAAGGGAAAPAAGGGDLPAECNDYKAAIEKLASCDKMPQQARDALKNAYDQASAGWANLPAEAKANLATACKVGADAVMQSAKSVCGW
jgi:hypothetical protein